MARDAVALLDDIVAEVRFLSEVTQGIELEDLAEDVTLKKAVERSLEVMGEAAKAVPEEVRRKHPQIPWSEMARTRDLLIHAYHRIEIPILWKTVTEHAVPLLPGLEAVLERERATST